MEWTRFFGVEMTVNRAGSCLGACGRVVQGDPKDWVRY